MTVTADMLSTSPSSPGYDVDDLAACIDPLFRLCQSCTACADACLGAEIVAELRRDATGRVLSRQAGYDPELTGAALTACRDACRRCAEECDRHAEMHEHRRVCAAACRRCADACDRLLAA